MAAFTASTNGNWNDGATWGNTSPGTKGTDWPGLAGDTATIGSGRTVTYNVSETNELGAISITGLLTFATAANTKLTLGNSTITINNGGELRVGASGAVIGSGYTAELLWNTTGDNAQGITVAAGGKLTVYGDPALYGSDDDTTLQANWTTGTTLTVVGDFTTKWAANQILIVHKGAVFANRDSDVALVTIASVAANGGNTDITINESFPTGTFTAGSVVLNVSRNVKIGKLSATTTIGNNNTNRPRILDNNSTAGNFIIVDAAITGIYNVAAGAGTTLTRTVVRNGFYALSGGTGCSLSGHIFSNSVGVNVGTLHSISGYFFSNSTGVSGGQGHSISASVFSNTNGINGGSRHSITGSVYGNSVGVIAVGFASLSGYVFKNATGIQGGTITISGSVGYDSGGNVAANTNDFAFYTAGGLRVICLGVKTASPPTFAGRTTGHGAANAVCLEDYGHTMGANYTFQICGDAIKNTTTVRTGGGASSIEIVPNAYCVSGALIQALEWTEFAVAASAQTKSVYMLGSGWSANYPTASELWFEAEYLSHATLPTKTVVKSTAVLSDNTTWTQFSVTFTPSQAGIVRYRAYLGKYASGCKVYIDNQLVTA